MNLRIASVFTEAAALFRRDAALLWPLAGLFFFVPSLAQLLLLPTPAIDPAASQEARLAAALHYYNSNAPWLLMTMLIVNLGTASIFALYLGGERMSVGEALAMGARRLIRLVLATMLTNLAIIAGLMLFIVPGIYLIGRTLMVGATMVARPQLKFIDAMVEGVALTGGGEGLPVGRAFQLAGIWLVLAVAIYAGLIIAGAIGAAAPAMGLTGLAATVPDAILSSLAMAAANLMGALVQLVLYRRLTAPRNGI